MRCISLRASLIVAAACLWAGVAWALINPRFTPKELFKQSQMILVVDVKEGNTKDEYLLTTRDVLKKGTTDEKVIRLDISKARDERAADLFRRLAASGRPGLFFVGAYGSNPGGPEKRGLLHLDGQWASCVANSDGVWLYDTLDDALQAVWNGGTDMLRRAVDYVIADDDASVPVTDGVQWSDARLRIAGFAGTIRRIRPVDLAGDGTRFLFVARDQGDRLLACGKGRGACMDVTETRGLRSTSLVHAWGNFTGQGRLDLVSFDGKGATLHAQQADGTFTVRPLELGTALDDGCLSLAAIDAGAGDRAGLVVGGNGLPVVVAFDAAGKVTGTPLTAADVDLAKLGPAGVTLVADFDADGVADVLALRDRGGILFRGRAAGQFHPGVASAARCGDAQAGVCVGDYDGDGNLDVLVAGGTTRLMWINDGKGSFTERFNAVGEMMTHAQAVRGSDCTVGDVNNDGRQDVLIAYDNTSPVTYFGRGFLSFGHCHSIDVAENNSLPAANNARDGVQSACLADLDGDGAQDLALALAAGEIWVLFRENDAKEALMVVADLPIDGPARGPVAVTGWIGERCLGAWNVSPGTGPACFGRTEPGPVTLRWRLPGGQPQSREVVIEQGGTVRFPLR
jgi:hypothetical protein